jgi:branched-chain amino acid transport system permease protein
MDFPIAFILLQDGLTLAAVYALLAVALVLVFSITRVIFVPQGEFVAFGALTAAALQAQRLPPTVYLLMALGALVFAAEALAKWRDPDARPTSRDWIVLVLKYLAAPAALAAIAHILKGRPVSPVIAVVFALAVIAPMGPMVYRLGYQPLERASVLVLLIVSVALHFALVGLGLAMFGPEGYRTDPLLAGTFNVGPVSVAAQTLLVFGVVIGLIVAMYLYFEHSFEGKALRATAVNPRGAKLVGISPSAAGRIAFAWAAGIGALCGVLIVPLTTLYYDSGFLVGLKGFVAAVFGGLASYPLALAGASMVGLLESFSSFWLSAYKEVIVFTLIIPVMMWRSLVTPHSEDEH